MRFSFTVFSVMLIIMCIIMQQQSVAAKPFIFKFFVPQAPTHTNSNSSPFSSSSSSTGIDFSNILSTKLNLLTRLLQTGISIGLNKFHPNIQITSTRKPYTSTTVSAPDYEYKTSTMTSLKSTTAATSTFDKSTQSDNLSETIDNKGNNGSLNRITTEKNDNDNTTSKDITKNTENEDLDNSADKASNDHTTTNLTTDKSSNAKLITYLESTANNGYSYDHSNNLMSEDEISNDIMMTSNEYLPPF